MRETIPSRPPIGWSGQDPPAKTRRGPTDPADPATPQPKAVNRREAKTRPAADRAHPYNPAGNPATASRTAASNACVDGRAASAARVAAKIDRSIGPPAIARTATPG
jgi:hypothetical protein